MSANAPISRLDQLLERWESSRKRGQDLSAAELAADDPELLPELERQMAAIDNLGRILHAASQRSELADESGADELADMLRRRLVAVLVICLTYAAVDWLILFGSMGSGGPPPPIADRLVPFATLTLLLATLWWRRGLSLRSLRVVEIVLFGFLTLTTVWAELDWYGTGWVQQLESSPHMEKMSALAGASFNVHWLVLFVLYGAFIPNEGRRCAIVVGSMAFVAIVGMVGLSSELPPELQRQALARKSLYLVMGSAIAIYGSHRLSALRRDSAQARKLGQYVLKRYLGGGGMGEVYLAEHQLLRRLCAVKIIRPEQLGDGRSFQRFEREVKATASLTHGSIVDIYDYGRTDQGLFFYVMEYLPGLTLQELVERFGALPPARVVYLMRQLCWGLREAHANGLIHRDVKPGNILVCERGLLFDVAKLVDFGLVKESSANETVAADRSTKVAAAVSSSSDLTESGHIVGTPRYMSPEQISGVPPLDGRSDLYSLGLVMYFALTGKHAFGGSNFRELAHAHLHAAALLLIDACPDVDCDLHVVVMRCLEKDRNQRYPHAETLELALASCLCANQWSASQAASWWQVHGTESDPR